MGKRGSGVLLHISSLESNFGIGDLGAGAYKFIDFLKNSNQKYWQVLPLNPTNLIYGNSPYSSVSAFAANTILISPQSLLEEGLLEEGDLDSLPDFLKAKVDYAKIYDAKAMLFECAYKRFEKHNDKSDFKNFCFLNEKWLDNYAAFIVFKTSSDVSVWNQWPQPIRDRQAKAINELEKQNCRKIEKEKFLQYLFFKQWSALKSYANKRGVQIIGDIPIYVNYDSVDVWTNPSIFKLDNSKNLKYLAGVPPDYFSKTGQLWGNPVYDWGALKKTKYQWWFDRIEHNLKIFDWVRIDHFRGFVDFWQVPAKEETAINGSWEKAPAKDFFKKLLKKYPEAPIIAEDLGIITDEVKETISDFGFPGMKILLFAFFEDLEKHPYLPHNYISNCVAYTGTHDNNTVKGWFENELNAEGKKKLFSYLGKEIPPEELHWEMIRILMESKADMVIIPMQDILGLGQEDRMNLPGISQGNWQWKLRPEELNSEIIDKLAILTRNTNR